MKKVTTTNVRVKLGSREFEARAEKLPQKSEMVAPSNHPRNFVFMVGTAVLRHIIKITSSYKIMECATWQVSLFIKESYCEKYLYILMIIYIYIYIYINDNIYIYIYIIQKKYLYILIIIYIYIFM